VISRGYGRVTKDCREVMDNSEVGDVGDEPALIKRVTSAPVFVATRRVQAGAALLARYPDTQIILCDDGLQHLALKRNLEICVFDDRGVGNGFLLPAGPLREPWPRIVDLVLHTGKQPAFAGFRAARQLAPYALRKDGSQVAWADLTNDKPLLAVAAIAKPEDFFNMLREAGLPLAKTLALPDHYDFSDWSTSSEQDFTLLCTEKDAAKLWHKSGQALAIPLIVEPEAAFLRQLDSLLADLPIHDPKLSSHHGHTTS
jgi:tetraacyldisaccharide 4'-kinase